MSQGTKAQNLCSIRIQCWQHSSGQKPTGLAHYMISLCHEIGLVGGCSPFFEFLHHHIEYNLKNKNKQTMNQKPRRPQQYNEYTWLSLPFVFSFWLFHRSKISWTKCMSNFRVHIVSYMSPPSNLILLIFYTYSDIIACICILSLPFPTPHVSFSHFLPLKVIYIGKLHP